MSEYKKDSEIMHGLNGQACFLDVHQHEGSILMEEAGFLFEICPTWTHQPTLERKIRKTIIEAWEMEEIHTSEQEGVRKVPFFEIRNGTAFQKLKSDEHDIPDEIFKAQVLQLWASKEDVDTLRRLMTETIFDPDKTGIFVPYSRDRKFESPRSYATIINRQNRFNSIIKPISVFNIEPTIMETNQDQDKRGLESIIRNKTDKNDEYLFLSIERTQETETKGKWILLCHKRRYSQAKQFVEQELPRLYKETANQLNLIIHEEQSLTKQRATKPDPTYREYFETLLLDEMDTNDGNDSLKASPLFRRNNGRPPSTITTSKQAKITSDTPYIDAIKRSSATKTSVTKQSPKWNENHKGKTASKDYNQNTPKPNSKNSQGESSNESQQMSKCPSATETAISAITTRLEEISEVYQTMTAKQEQAIQDIDNRAKMRELEYEERMEKFQEWTLQRQQETYLMIQKEHMAAIKLMQKQAEERERAAEERETKFQQWLNEKHSESTQLVSYEKEQQLQNMDDRIGQLVNAVIIMKQGQDNTMERMPPSEAKRTPEDHSPIKSSPPITRVTKRATGVKPAKLFDKMEAVTKEHDATEEIDYYLEQESQSCNQHKQRNVTQNRVDATMGDIARGRQARC